MKESGHNTEVDIQKKRSFQGNINSLELGAGKYFDEEVKEFFDIDDGDQALLYGDKDGSNNASSIPLLVSNIKKKRQKKAKYGKVGIVAAIGVIAAISAIGVTMNIRAKNARQEAERIANEKKIAREEAEFNERKELLNKADALALGYDYDAAIELLKDADVPEYSKAVKEYESKKAACSAVDITQTTHVFFHILIADPSITFDHNGPAKDKISDYNQVMTTIDEFNGIIQSMYDRGYVLVSIHDLVKETVDEEGNTVFTKGEIFLPPGKKPFVLSEDDVCYYFYMQGHGYATKLVVGEDGKPVNEYVTADGQTVTGSYDVVPLLDDFIEKHPDFSYKGAKGILALTGYNGILGYRTDPDLAVADEEHEACDVEAEREAVKPVIQCLKDDGWELASHSYGHISYGSELPVVQGDNQKWQDTVGSLIGPTDIILFPFGTDIGDWHPYSSDNEKFNYLYQQGFRFFCNVDSSQYWVQFGDNFLRQGRRNLDGYRMYQDLYNGKDLLSDLFDVASIYDRARPEDGLKVWDGAG